MENQKINELINLIAEQAGIYDDILKISRDKTDIIVKGKVIDLENITKIEQSLVIKLGKLEAKREDLVKEISKDLDLDPEEMIVSDLVDRLDSKQAEELKRLKDSLALSLKELKDTNELNSKLIKNSLDYIDFSINLYSNISTGENNYGRTGEVNDDKKKSFLDLKL
ncbi:MAG: flagellar protein FlgN [Clostridiaceae bacterium]|nr:flagellar protein FlgN [Clostridiaceae bacterium]